MGAAFCASGHVRGKLSGSFVLGPGSTLAVGNGELQWQRCLIDLVKRRQLPT